MTLQIETRYPLSMTGIQASGKKTLRDSIAARLPSFVAVELELLKLGRMVDVEGLSTFRQRYRELDSKVKDACGKGLYPVTQRLGVLDVAVVAEFMSRAGRIDRSAAAAFLDEVQRDLPSLSLPRVLVAVRCNVDTLLRRLEERDQQSGLKASRGAKPLAALQSFLDGIMAGTETAHPLIGTIVGHYRTAGLLLTIDTSNLAPEPAQDRVIAFLREKGVPCR